MNETLHIPERLPGESFADYRLRRQESHRINAWNAKGRPVHRHIGHGRRLMIEAAGGIRQFKRLRTARRLAA